MQRPSCGEENDNPIYHDYDNNSFGCAHAAKDPIWFYGGLNLFLYVDSVGKPSNGLNLFLYTENDPINFIDPTGLFREEGGTIFDDEGIPIGEAGLESPNPFLDPINYIGLGGGLEYKNTYWLKNACGLELKVSRNLRFGWHRLPKGNYPGAGKNLPHAHWRPGIGKHRPWETIFNKIRNWFN